MLIPFCLILSILWTYAPVALSSPIASPNPAPLPALTENLTGGNGYTGSGGNAVGGNVLASKNSKAGLLGLLTGDKPLLSAFSGNAGNGGDASTGNALAGGVLRGGRVRGGYSSGLGLPAGNGRTAFPVPISGINLDQVTTNTNVGNAYTGAGGNAAGGTVSAAAGLIDLFSRQCIFPFAVLRLLIEC